MNEYSEIYIDPEESLKSFLEKVQSVDSQNLVVIIHQQSSIFMGQINIELIKKYAQRVNKELIFITNIKKMKNLLEGVGFKVCPSLKKFKEEKEIKESNPEFKDALIVKKPKIKAKRSKFKKAALFFLMMLIIASGWFYLNFPAVTIEVAPVVKTKQVISNLTAELGQKQLDYNQQRLPLFEKEVELKTTIQVQATGEKSVGVKYAAGVVTFINNTKGNITIPKGTVVATRNGIKYKTLAKVVIPKLEIEKMMGVVVGARAGKEEVNIRALNKGEIANVSKGRIVEFVNRDYPVKLINPEATTGGKNKLLSQITEQDLAKGFKKAQKELTTAVQQELAKKFGAEMIFFKEQVKLEEPEFSPQSKVGALNKQLTIIAKINAAGVAVKKSDLKNLVYQSYNKNLGEKFRLYKDNIKVKAVEVVNNQAKSLELRAVSTGQVIGNLNQVELINEILGKKVANVKSLLDNMNEVANYNISPNNQINVPQFKYGVKVVVVEPSKE
ncbi:MAG: baseplate J/gp47 family protein [Bacillota bacterium]